MFHMDPALLPPLTTRKALLVVDAQNDFLAEGGALPAKMPIDLSQRISDLANGFRRSGGEIIWMQSQFESSRPIADEQILISDIPSPSSGLAAARGRRPRTAPLVTESESALISPEAFLTLDDAGKGPNCVRLGAPGTELHPVVKQAVGPKDHVLIKTFYSAFKSDELLRLLRVRFVTELFICGSSTNVGVMATAIDAASYGYIITIVDDCCGSRSMARHRIALRQITNTTGCEMVPAAKVLGLIKPKSSTPEHVDHHQAAGGTGRPPTVRLHRGNMVAVAPSASDILSSLERLSLRGEPAADEHAPEIGAQQQSPSALQSLARSDHPQTSKEQTDRDTVGPSAQPSAVPRRSKESSESVETPPTPISTTPKDDAAAAHDPFVPSTIESRKSSSTMTPIQGTHSRESETLCEGDTKVIYDILPDPLVQNIFERINGEVNWQRMSHQGGEVPRLVAVQGKVDADGSKPVYRHPADESPPLLPFTPTVDEIRRVVEAKLGHPLNHVLIQFYRHGNDYISEHSDKTLDIAKGSFIANVSLGAERTMTLRTKRQPKDAGPGSGSSKDDEPPSSDGLKRQVQRARLPHNSLFQMGLATNMRWMHAIRQDKRLAREKLAAELAYDGARISLTFRRIGTFLDGDDKRIWGQGATGKTKDEAREVINGQTPEAVNMLRAFGRENQSTVFDWDLHYGSGFDVLHITAAARLFMSADPVVNMRVQLMLAELGIGYARGSMTASSSADDLATLTGAGVPLSDVAIKFVDNDKSKTAVEGQRDIMLYLQKTYGESATSNSSPNTSTTNEGRAFERFQQGLSLLDEWRAASSTSNITKLLAPWETHAEGEDKFIAGPTLGLADFAFWPVLHVILSSLPEADAEAEKNQLGVPNLLTYYDRIRAREPITQMLATTRP
ncbi:hypothetical protein HD806DRAFT_545228 [Xylariaceae sp. AK1471]|nr:hypothetical protein HD806DRAFT_545228 [Xylariaceae sp. AK1471]